MLGYWDTVADRLYKIRHCMNIEGVVRQLALFEPPIEPGALVKAVAGGVDIGNALTDLNVPLPLYRFNVLLQKANEVCNDVKTLGGALLAALEKRDAEALGLLRQSQEIRLLEAVEAVRAQQIEEAKEHLAAMQKGQELAQIRKQYYESREFMNAEEKAATVLNGLSIVSHTAGTIADVLAGVMFLIPDFKMGASGFGGTPHLTTEPPTGKKIGESVARGANGLYNLATILDKSAGLVATLASYQRRQEEWDLQANLAAKDIEQIDNSIAAAELRIAMAEKELENHVLQIENAKATDAFMRSKYTNEELYQWQVGQISQVYFQSYKLAYDLAKRAERCFRFELGLQDSDYIQFGYWDSLKKGLLSGEKLQYDLRRLETAYLEQNRREFELTKHISLALLDPLALVKLRETGRCFFRLPEEIFDLDYPGHYFRRIKSVSLTLPCIVGPYTTIACTLRLLKNSIRINTANGDEGYARNTDAQGSPADDGRFVETNVPVKAIAVSNAQNDSGVFELSFRDERYLPFEGAGAVSEWSLELFTDPERSDFGTPLRQFDYRTISDAILHVKYTAREDAGMFKNGAVAHLRTYFSQGEARPSLRLLNLRQEFPTEWHRFLHPTNPANGNIFELEMSPSLFPFRDAGKTLNVNTIWLLARCTYAGDYKVVVMSRPLPEPTEPTPDEQDNGTMTLRRLDEYGGLHFSEKEVATPGIQITPTHPPVTWQLQMARPDGRDLQEDVQDVLIVLGYSWNER
jgi:Tc toxin complex TcA C-terminal TcB-binding domain